MWIYLLKCDHSLIFVIIWLWKLRKLYYDTWFRTLLDFWLNICNIICVDFLTERLEKFVPYFHFHFDFSFLRFKWRCIFRPLEKATACGGVLPFSFFFLEPSLNSFQTRRWFKIIAFCCCFVNKCTLTDKLFTIDEKF